MRTPVPAGRPALLVALLAALVAGTLVVATAVANAPTRAPVAAGRAGHDATVGTPRVHEYVALGDSYTAGPFIPGLLPALGCFRSTRNYPSQVARRLDVQELADVSCSGAATSDVTRRQHTGFASVPPQLAAVSRSTDLVTIGLGGNDFGVFGRLVSVCPQARARTGDTSGAPCRNVLEDGDQGLLPSLDRTERRMRGVLRRVVRRAPGARVLVVGYPRVAAPGMRCPRVLPFAGGDLRYADEVTRRLNLALRRAARAHGAAYVDTYRVSRGHDACAGEQAWVNGAGSTAGPGQSYHPVAAYMTAVADLVEQRVATRAPTTDSR
jgi:lysophospholipase L1-like esterase